VKRRGEGKKPTTPFSPRRGKKRTKEKKGLRGLPALTFDQGEENADLFHQLIEREWKTKRPSLPKKRKGGEEKGSQPDVFEGKEGIGQPLITPMRREEGKYLSPSIPALIGAERRHIEREGGDGRRRHSLL